MILIHARDALHLPCASISASDAEAARAILVDVDTYVRANMKRGGCAVPLDKSRFNEVIAAEVIRACQKQGWGCALEQKFRQSEITGTRVEEAFVLSLVPGLDCYEDIDKTGGTP